MAKLKHFIKVDGKGNVIPGSSIKRKRKPEGNWIEIRTKECCDPVFDIPTTTTTTL